MRRLLWSLTLLCVTSAAASAVNLDSLLTQSVGGPAALEKLRAVTSIYASGKATLNGMPGTLETLIALPNRLSVELKLGPFVMTQAFDGLDAWQRTPNGQITLISGYEKRTLMSQVYFQTYSHIFPDRLPGGKEYLGIDTIQGRRCHKVAIYPFHADTVHCYFDTATGYQLFDATTLDNLDLQTAYSDHRMVGGILMSMTSHATAPAAGTDMTVTIDSIGYDVPFAPDRFTRPSSLVDYRFPDGVDSVVVPFQFMVGHIYFKATVNGRTLLFLLDSGASANLFNRPALDGLNLPVVGNLPAAGVAGYENVDLIETDSLCVGDLVLLSQVGGVLDLSALGLAGGGGNTPLGGLLGYDFLSRFPVLIDYQNSLLVVYDPVNFVEPVGGKEVPFEFTMQVPTIRAELIGLPGQFIVDLGNPYGLIVHREFSRTNDLLSRLGDVQDLPASLGGVGGGIDGKSAYAATFAFADIRVSDLRVILPESGGGLSGSVELAGNIGNLLLGQFRVLFDYASQRLIFYEASVAGE